MFSEPGHAPAAHAFYWPFTVLLPLHRRFSEPGSAPAAHAFATADGKCEGSVAAYKGGKVDWITTCKFFSSELGFGNLRIDGWATRDTRAPRARWLRCTGTRTCARARYAQGPEGATAALKRQPPGLRG